MSDVITRRAQDLEEFLRRLKWNGWTEQSKHPHSSYWAPEVWAPGIEWTFINVPNETHHEFDLLMLTAKERLHEWVSLVVMGTDPGAQPEADWETEYEVEDDEGTFTEEDKLDEVKEYLRRKGCTLWGRAFNLIDDADSAAKWLIKEIDGLWEFLMEKETKNGE